MTTEATIVRLQDIAARCGVTRMLVSMALRGDRKNVSAATMARIQAMATEMGYNPARSHAARRLQGQKNGGPPVLNHVVAFPIPVRQLQDPYFARIMDGIGRVLERERFGILLNFDAGADATGTPAALPEPFCRGDVDGTFLIAGGAGEPFLDRLRAEPNFGARPVVGILIAFPDSAAVLADDYAGALALGRHLLAEGHRECLLDWQGGAVPFARHRGLYAAFREAGLEPRRHFHLLRVDLVYDLATGRARLEKAMLAHPGATVVIAANDLRARRLATALAALGRPVPEQMALVGFDDTWPVPGPDGANLLTTVRLPLEDVGTRAAELLLARIHGRATSDRVVTLPVELVVRASSALPRRTR